MLWELLGSGKVIKDRPFLGDCGAPQLVKLLYNSFLFSIPSCNDTVLPVSD